MPGRAGPGRAEEEVIYEPNLISAEKDRNQVKPQQNGKNARPDDERKVLLKVKTEREEREVSRRFVHHVRSRRGFMR